MKPFRFLVALAVSATLLTPAALPAWAADSEGDSTVEVVNNVDLTRYVGLWYEIAKIPNRFQKKCARGTTAEYTLRADGRITVANRCYREDGKLDDAKGEAKIVDPATNAKLEVSFVSFLGWRPFWGDYWIIGLDQDYRWAVIGTPDRKYGWVLSRTPTLDEGTLDVVFAVIERNGYARGSFEMSLP